MFCLRVMFCKASDTVADIPSSYGGHMVAAARRQD